MNRKKNPFWLNARRSEKKEKQEQVWKDLGSQLMEYNRRLIYLLSVKIIGRNRGILIYLRGFIYKIVNINALN